MCKLCNTDKKPKEYIRDVSQRWDNRKFRDVVFQYTSEYPCASCLKAYGVRKKDISIDDFIINRLKWIYISCSLKARDISNARMKIARLENTAKQVRVSRNIIATIRDEVIINYIVRNNRGKTVKSKFFSNFIDAIAYRDSVAFKPKGRMKHKTIRVDECIHKTISGNTGRIGYRVQKRVNRIDISKSFDTLEEAREFLAKLEER